jgi:hypothetical protein
MIPPLVAADAPKGEKQLFARLRDDPNARDWLVLHSFDIRRHVARAEGEADMVVVVPGLGVLCRGQGCRVRGALTYSYNRPRLRSAPFASKPGTPDSSVPLAQGLFTRVPRVSLRSLVLEVDFADKSLGVGTVADHRANRVSPAADLVARHPCAGGGIPSVVRASRYQLVRSQVVQRFDNWRPSEASASRFRIPHLPATT